MTCRERFLAVMNFEEVDRTLLWDCGYWGGTIMRWYKEGLPKRKGLPELLLEKAGLVLKKKDGSFYDRFRHRIIFPILDIKGKIRGFGGRVLDEGMPKYMNSPETHIYNKGRHLYGLNLTWENIRSQDKAIIVEGYLDLLTPLQPRIMEQDNTQYQFE